MPARTLGPSGSPAIDWATRSMPLLAASIAEDAPVFAGLHIGICIHIEPKTAVLCRWLLDQGARVTITGNVGTTVPETAEALRAVGVTVIGGRSDDADQHDRNLDELLAALPDLVMDNGGELIAKLTRGAPRSATFRGATEETTTGGIAVRALPQAPDFPVVVINDSRLKLIVENEHGVGQSIVQGFMNATNAMVPGARATVVGYGPCGKGVADTLRSLGAVVSVVDTDPFRALEAIMRGHRVGPMSAVLPGTELLFLATGGRRSRRARARPGGSARGDRGDHRPRGAGFRPGRARPAPPGRRPRGGHAARDEDDQPHGSGRQPDPGDGPRVVAAGAEPRGNRPRGRPGDRGRAGAGGRRSLAGDGTRRDARQGRPVAGERGAEAGCQTSS